MTEEITQSIIWSINNCPYCEQAKKFLNSKGVPIEERNITTGPWTKVQLLEMVPTAKTVPQIFIHGTYVGGYSELMKYAEEHGMFENL